MSRLSNRKIEAVLNAATEWKQRCLVNGTSIFGTRSLWTESNLHTLEEAFFGNLISDPERTFIEKLKEQLSTKPAPIAQLASELTWVMLLFPSNIQARRKRKDIVAIWSWSGSSLSPDLPMLGEPLALGIGHAGVAFNTLRWREFGYFVRVIGQFKQLPTDKRSELLPDPWAFTAWVDSIPESRNRAMRHVLLYLLFPDTFEAIVAPRHKRVIARHYASLIELPALDDHQLQQLPLAEIDRRLMNIRGKLELKYPGQDLDFYAAPLLDEIRVQLYDLSTQDAAGSVAPVDKNSTEAVRIVLDTVGNAALARPVLFCLAECIELAHEISPSRWAVSLKGRRVRLTVGRLFVFTVSSGSCQLGIIEHRLGPDASPELRERIKSGFPFSRVGNGYLLKVSDDEFPDLVPVLKPALIALIEAASQTAKRPSRQGAHAPEVLDFLENYVGRKLPRPGDQDESNEDLMQLPAATLVATPRFGFRATELDLASLVSDIENGDIGLPDIQRPFVWTNAKVRDLFDSMYRGYPVGYLLFWEASPPAEAPRVIGTNRKAFRTPRRLIVDGQQRLTSLFAVMRGEAVFDDDYRRRKIEIAFRPRDGRFEVADAAIRRDPQFIADLSQVLLDDRGSFAVISEFLNALSERRSQSDEEKQIIGKNLERLFSLRQYRFSILEISADVPEEAVAEIFVRINSEGVKLNQADFILTLLSVFWEEGRKELEDFSRKAKRPPEKLGDASPYNHLFQPSPDQMLRAAVALGFGRARLKAVYQLLRGKNPDTGALEPNRREEQLGKLRAAQAITLNLNNWHQFLLCVTGAGFRLTEQIPSENALILAYALYLYGRTRANLEGSRLERLIGRWFFMSVVTSRYTGSPETMMERDLGRVVSISAPEPFEAALNAVIEGALTGDFWSITLPMALETSGVRSPGWSAFVAAQLRLGAPVLFSDKALWMILDPLTRGTRRPFEVHHLFPKSWLLSRRISDRKETDQIANMALLEWPANARVSGKGPAEYVPELRKEFPESEWHRMSRFHALPPDWELLEYGEFLRERRMLMAGVIRKAFEDIGGHQADTRNEAGTATEEEAWRLISALEKELRQSVGAAYRRKWGADLEDHLRKVLGDAAWATIEKNREKQLRQYPLADASTQHEIFDFMYLGQLVDLMINGQAWDMFRSAFRDKRQLEDIRAALIPVRNDAAHFRSVPAKELQRSVIAADDLRRLVKSLHAFTS